TVRVKHAAHGPGGSYRRAQIVLQLGHVPHHVRVQLVAVDELADRAVAGLHVFQDAIHDSQLLLELCQVQALHQTRRSLITDLATNRDVGRSDSTGDVDKLIANQVVGRQFRGRIAGDGGEAAALDA